MKEMNPILAARNTNSMLPTPWSEVANRTETRSPGARNHALLFPAPAPGTTKTPAKLPREAETAYGWIATP